MKVRIMIGAAALAAACAPGAAWADDPNDPALRNRAARAADAAITRSLNGQALARVRQRDAGYDREAEAGRSARAEYDRQMAEWRRAVRLCESGQRQYCAR